MPYLSRRRSVSANTLTSRPIHRLVCSFADPLKIAVYILILLLISGFLLVRYTIEQTSMEPTFHPGQRIVVSRAESTITNLLMGAAYAAHSEAAGVGWLQRGQVVVFYESEDRESLPLIKRLIGIPGDHVQIYDGVVLINGAQLAEPYLTTGTACDAHCDLTLGPSEYFFMGDNRSVSRDSRQFGPIPANQIVGRVVLRFWPLDQLAISF